MRIPGRTCLCLLLATCCAADPPPPASQPVARTGWIGNSFGGADGKWVQNNIAALFVAPDGTCFTDSFWDEGGHEAGVYRDGDAAGALAATHGAARGGWAVVADDNFAYLACSAKDRGAGLRRYDRRSGKPARFPGGAGDDGSFLRLGDAPASVRGMAMVGGELFVTDHDANRVRVISSGDMREQASFALDHPQRIAADAAGTLWIIQEAGGGQPAAIVHRSRAGASLPGRIADVEQPVALAVDKDDQLLVADDGPDQQVKRYANLAAEPKFAGTIGERGGVFSDGHRRGETGPLRFNGLTGVGADAAGNVYVATNGLGPRFADHPGYGTELRCLTPAGRLKWHLQGLEFVDCAITDPGAEADVYTKDEHFVFDDAQPPWQPRAWCRGCTIDRFRFPEDPRLHLSAECPLAVRRLGGRRYLYLTDMYAAYLAVFRLDDASETAVPCAMFAREPLKGGWPAAQPPVGAWIWRDFDGNGRMDPMEFESHRGDNPFAWGWSVDADGTVWEALREDGIRRFPLNGIDLTGTPSYSYATSQLVPNPPPFIETRQFKGDVNRVEYDAVADAMYLAGYTPRYPNKPPEWGQVGTVICRYDNWSKGNRTPRWQVTPPYDPPAGVLDKAMCVAGNHLFVAAMRQPRVLVYDLATGRQVATLTPDPAVVGKELGWVDVPYGIRAARRPSGEYVIFVEEDARAKILVYQWAP